MLFKQYTIWYFDGIKLQHKTFLGTNVDRYNEEFKLLKQGNEIQKVTWTFPSYSEGL